ncbi:bromodomain-containing protein [Aureococcus anophagefferens]|nr:bromodomain-containing protein [Aureococcus anophagefferens]
MKGEALHAARQVLDRLFAQDPSNLWGAPVNTALYSDYLSVVKRPIDLGTVRARVESYATMAAFAADVRLVYENSALYCKARFPDVAKGARTILRKFDKECQGPLRPFLQPAARSAWGDDGAASAARQPAAAGPPREKLPMTDAVDSAVVRGPGQPMDLNKLEVRHRSGVYRRDVGAWVRDARRIAANCLRYNVDVRFPELRNAGRAWLAAVEKEVEHKLRPALRAAGATDVELDKAVPRLLPRYEKILSAVEDAVLNVYDGGVQRCYAFISPITAYYDAREQGQKRTLDDYLRAVPEPMCVNEVFRRLLEGDYKRPDDVARDVELIFANCRAYYGPRGSGRVLHGDADADAYCELAKLFSARWKAKLPDLAKAPAKRDDRRPSPSSKPPAAKPPPKRGLAAKILDALRAVKHPDGQEAALGFLHENMLPPEQGEYATAIGGAHNTRDFNRIEAKARGGGYRNLQAFGDDVAKCFANARAWKARVEFLHRGSPEAWCSQKPIAGAIVEGADLLAPLLRTYLAEAPVEAPKSVPKLKIKKLARPPPPPSALAQSAAHVALTSPAPARGGRRARRPKKKRAPGDVARSPAAAREPWVAQADRLFDRVRKHEWVKPDGYYGKVVGWHRPAVEAFPLIRHEYLAKIARPMDLGQAVVDDLVLVFDNAIAFNADAATGVNGPKDDLAAKMVDIASHMKHVIHHWALEFFKDEDGAAASSAATRDTAATRNGVCRDDYAVDAVDAALAGDAAAPAPAPPPEKPKGKSIEKPKLPPRAQARFDARRARDAAVWPSTLKYNPKGIGEARQVLRGVRKQHLKKHSQWFEKPCWRGVPDYSQFVSQPTCLERVDARLSLCARDRANLLDAAAAAAGIDDDKQLEPYETMGDFAAECKRIFDNALAYNERYRNDALFALALEGYERVKREEILLRWDKSTARGLNVEAAERREEHLQQRAVAKRKIEEMAARDRTSTRAKREKLLRVLGRAAVVSLDVLDARGGAQRHDGERGPDRPRLRDPAAAVEAAPLVAAPGVDVSRRRDAAAKAVANAVLQALGGDASGGSGEAAAQRCAALRRDERCRRALASVGGGARLAPCRDPRRATRRRELLVGGFLPVGESRALLATQPEATRRGGVDGVEAAFFFVVGGARLWIGGLAVAHEVLAYTN